MPNMCVIFAVKKYESTLGKFGKFSAVFSVFCTSCSWLGSSPFQGCILSVVSLPHRL